MTLIEASVALRTAACNYATVMHSDSDKDSAQALLQAGEALELAALLFATVKVRPERDR